MDWFSGLKGPFAYLRDEAPEGEPAPISPEQPKSIKKRPKKRKAKAIASPKPTPEPKTEYQHTVKVPVTTKQLVQTTKKIKVMTTVVEEQLDYEYVKEKYTVMETRKGQRRKEIWVKKVVMEPYEEQVPVTKYRRVKKPVKRFVEKEKEVEVEVPSQEIRAVAGFRVDTVKNPSDDTERIIGEKVYPRGRRSSVDLDSIPLDEHSSDRVLASPTKQCMPMSGEADQLPLADPASVDAPASPSPGESMEQVAANLEAYAGGSPRSPVRRFHDANLIE